MNWVVVRALLSLRDAINELGPNRDKGADGTIGDAAHQTKPSDHNPDDTPGSKTPHTDTDNIPEVHGLDIDVTGPWNPRVSMYGLVDAVIDVCKELGSRSPLAYIIYNRRIYEYPHWVSEPYEGSDPHTGHIHFSGRYGAGSSDNNPENFDGNWKLDERFAMLTPEDRASIRNIVTDVFHDLLDIRIGDTAYPQRTIGDVLRDTAKVRGVLVGDANDTKNAKLNPNSPLAKAIDLLTPPVDNTP